MKFISFLHNKQAKFGIINNESITDLTGKILGSNTLKELSIYFKKESSNINLKFNNNDFPTNFKTNVFDFQAVICFHYHSRTHPQGFQFHQLSKMGLCLSKHFPSQK